ncbi:MAG: 2-phospho-L-lactate transferase [Gammaproteobacteria bacterium]
MPAARVLAITGGVGGAKLALGLSRVLAPEELAFAVNTGDDFEHLGLHISPDLDSLMYALAGVNNTETGWGRADESWHFIETFRALGGEGWFNLGDRDLAVHVRRTELLRAGATLSEATATLCHAHGIEHPAWPMSDDPSPTRVVTERGELDFQHYFVRERCAPPVTHIVFPHAATARANPAILECLADPALAGVIICPSNPYLSVDPLLALPALHDALAACSAPRIAVSPIVGGEAIKGPTAKIMSEIGVRQDAEAIAQHYGKLIDGFILDSCDAGLVEVISRAGCVAIHTNTVMQSLDDRIELAHTAVDFLRQLS